MTLEIRCVVFSLDRPMQLDAFLTSMQRHAGDVFSSVAILYRSSTRRFAAAYDLAREAHPSYLWHEETEFRSDLLSLLDPSGYVVFHTDDDVFFADVEPFSIGDDEACFSLRLGLNVRYSYPLDLPEQVERPSVGATRISWDWRSQPLGSFSYPLALNGHVLRADETRALVRELSFSDPNALESKLHARRSAMRSRMAAFTTSCVVSIPANVVTRRFRNRHGGMQSASELNERFLAGERIATESMAFNAVSSCHQEIPFAFRRAADVPASLRTRATATP